ncbi:MAG: endonuclease/exonuclease/phosphatase family protein [Bacteroidota bacterium]
MRIIRPFLYLLIILAGAFLLFLVFATVDDYRPEKVTSYLNNNPSDQIADTSELNLLIWNIGYAGLDASMDFFYDGGEQMRPDEEGVLNNMNGISSTLSTFVNYECILLQEVDKNSKRSYHINEYEVIKNLFKDYHFSFGKNYNVAFVPIPLKEPMGKVESGLMTLSKHSPLSVERHSFPGNYSWPMKLFMLDRCFLVNRFVMDNGKELIIVNTHNSAYDDGSLRSMQMSFMKTFLLGEYRKGNYVIVGGDWNQTPHGFAPELPSHHFDTINLTYVEKDYPGPEWIWAFDPQLPTNRRVASPYDRSSSLTTVIDYYLLSPNVQIEEVETIDVDFKYSDHQPVRLRARLLPTH